MAPRVHGAPSRAAALALGIALTLALPLRSQAQYMYLDANGDGIHTAADVVSPTEATTVDVWLRTDTNRDGSAAACSTEAVGMSINAYEVTLHATNGSVLWYAIANSIPEFTIDLGNVVEGSDARMSWGSGTLLPPGTYHLVTIHVSVTSGTPSIAIVNSTPINPFYGTTFSSLCPGLEFDNTLKLGIDWFDVDGLAYGGNSAPVIQGMPDVSVTAGEILRQQFTATDVDGDPLVLSKAAGPSYMEVTKEGQSGGTATGLVTLTPELSDVGRAVGVLQASDGVLSSQTSFAIVVLGPGVHGATLLSMSGDSTDYISQGQSYLYEPPAAEFTTYLSPDASVRIQVSQPPVGNYWGLEFYPPGGSILQPGFYTDAKRAGFNGSSPGLSISGQGRGCNTLTGIFEIKQLEIGSDGALQAFWARFEQHCEGLTAGLTGEVRINAHAEVAVTAPLSRHATVGEVVTFQVTATSATGAEVALIALGLPEGAEFLTQGPGTGTLTWRPASPLEPTQVVFEGRDLEGHVDRSTTLLAADDRVNTSLALFSDPDDPVGGGVEWTFRGPEIGLLSHPFDSTQVLFNALPSGGGSFWNLLFATADGGRIRPGVYEGATGSINHVPGTPTLVVLRVPFGSCETATGRFEVVEAAYDSNGSWTGFHAYFTQQCGDPTRSITGEIRWNAKPAVDVTVPLSRAVREGEPTTITAIGFPATGAISFRIENLPLGATFSDLGDNSARLDWRPDFSQSGVYLPRLIATNTNGATASIPLRILVVHGNRPPVADAGGPYEGTVGKPVAFDGTRSSDPDGGALYYYWTFGDSSYADFSPNPFHTYAAAGEYQVVLTVYEQNFFTSDSDTTSASIHDQFAARMFLGRGSRDLRLGSGKPAWCVQVEPVRSSFAVADVDLSSLVLVSDSTSGPISRISALVGKSSVGTDMDGNGIGEVTACFAKSDLRQLFAYVSGRSVERVSVEGRLTNGSLFRATMQIEVFGNSGKAALAATPNPLNPETVLTYYLPQGSPLRLRIFDVAGRLVATLMDGPAPPGYGSVRWGASSGGGRIASGVYFASLETKTERRTLRLVVLK